MVVIQHVSLRGLALVVCVLALPGVSPGGELDFQRDIEPILTKHCWACHAAGDVRSGLRLDRRAGMLRGGDSGLPAVVPSKPEKSLLIEAINHVDSALEMPKGRDKLPASAIEQLTRWVKEGAVWPGQMEAVTREKSDHWSFQPVVRPEVPDIDETSGNPIDAFLRQRLRETGLSFSPGAEPRSLIRRTSIVLTGLPPTPKEMTAFLDAYAKDADAAYRALVERLLASPHFGERWAQHWLDVIRWAETNGSESNMYRKNAWVYRDYVIRSFNEDKPYNRFLFEQVAGDSVGQGDATGYLVAGPHVPAATVGQEPAAKRQARADRVDEVLQTVGASAMAMTIGCARCHNHKFDPISIADYYSLAAVFQDVEFGSRFPELADDHPRRVRGKAIFKEIDAQRQRLRPSGPWEEHWTGFREVHFAPTTTRSVRISFLWNSAFIDELEIFGPDDRRRNFALAAEGTQTDSPKELTLPRNELQKINDGQYGSQKWGARARKGSKQKPWVQFTFTGPRKINRIRLSSNREDFLETDYLQDLNTGSVTPYRIEVLQPAGRWQQVAATPQFDRLSKKHKERSMVMKRLQALIRQAIEEGPRPSFVGRFVRPDKTYIFGRGSPENRRDEVFPAGLTELGGDLGVEPYAAGGERRRAFAEWLTRPSNPLTARVAANRIWYHVFGRGIVATPSDFGAAGAAPTHPELLDWLASELMRPSNPVESDPPEPWSMKHLIRLMVLSQAFRQSSLPREECLAVDAGSALLWRFPPKRVEAEVIRDTILQASGVLDRKLGGRSYRIHNVKKRYAQWQVTDSHGPHTWRRMIYQERMRRVDDRMFTAFDFPDCGQVRPKRPVSTTPLQALNLMNSPFALDQSQRIADRANREADGDPEQAVRRCFQLLLGRSPDGPEQKACLELANQGGLSLVCRALINTNEFAFLP